MHQSLKNTQLKSRNHSEVIWEDRQNMDASLLPRPIKKDSLKVDLGTGIFVSSPGDSKQEPGVNPYSRLRQRLMRIWAPIDLAPCLPNQSN